MAIQLGSRLIAAYNAFLSPDPIDPSKGTGWGEGDWSSFEARKRRYRLLSAFADQDAWADRSLFDGLDQGAYRAIRDVLGIAFQVAEFWASHIYAGSIDPRFGDGREVDSAIPILMEVERPEVRDALAELSRRSLLATALPTLVRNTAIQGDGFLEVCDDADARTIRLNVVPAGHVRECRVTAEGVVTAYHLEHMIDNPAVQVLTIQGKQSGGLAKHVRYEEIVQRQPDGGVSYETFIDGKPYQWAGSLGSAYTLTREQMPFVPLVKIQHRNSGLGWGKSELAPAITGMREVADLASCLTDWSRRVLNSPMLLSGVRNPAARPGGNSAAVRQKEAGDEYGGLGMKDADKIRQEIPFLFADAGARPWSLTDSLPVGDIGGQLDRLRAKLIDDYPELAFEKIRLSGQASGESFREARKPVEDKIRQRRIEPDHGLERAMRMGLTLGGIRGYDRYRGIDLGSYERGELDFTIDPARPAFTLTQADKIADRTAKWVEVKAAKDAGAPLELAMRLAGFSVEDIAEATDRKAAADEASMEQQRRLMAGSEMVNGVMQ